MDLLKFLFPVPPPEKFARKVMRFLKNNGETRPISILHEDFALCIGDPTNEANRLFLHNCYTEYQTAPWHKRKSVLAAYARCLHSVKPVPKLFRDAQAHLLPRIRERWFYESTNFQLKLTGDHRPWLFRPMAEHYAVELIYDMPDAISLVTREQLAEWSISFDEALAVARDNLWKISQNDFTRLGPGTYLSDWHDNHDAARLFLHDLIWQLPVNGKHVAFVPNRDTLLVTGSQDVAGLEMAAEITRKLLGEPRPMAGFPLILEGNKWQFYAPDPQAPAYATLHNLNAISMLCQYTEQESLLKKELEPQENPPYVTQLKVIQCPDTPIYKIVTIWGESCEALLPEASLVRFFSYKDQQPEALGDVPWDRVQRIAGDLMERLDIYPPRWHVRKFPTPAQLQQLLDPEASLTPSPVSPPAIDPGVS